MRFRVLPSDRNPPAEARNTGYLQTDNWNDFWTYQTQYYLTYFDDTGQSHDLGSVKIGQFGWDEEQGRPDIPNAFENLDNRFFSLGQEPDYYSRIQEFAPETSARLLAAPVQLLAPAAPRRAD